MHRLCFGNQSTQSYLMASARNLSEDLTCIRDLAEAGQNAPLLGGLFLAMWGGLVTLAHTGHDLIATGAFGVAPFSCLVLWLSTGLLGGIGQFVTGAMTGSAALQLAGVAAFAGLLAATFLTGTEYIWLVGAASAFAAVFVPGLMMMRAEPSETV
jgi:hypothetical protein